MSFITNEEDSMGIMMLFLKSSQYVTLSWFTFRPSTTNNKRCWHEVKKEPQMPFSSSMSVAFMFLCCDLRTLNYLLW